MALEIERKFLLKKTPCLVGADYQKMTQGYLGYGPLTTRVRISSFNGEYPNAWLTIKSPPVTTSACNEWEYEIPAAEAREILNQPGIMLLDKTRYHVIHLGEEWEVDEYHGSLQGLWTAEIELPCEGAPVELPDWIGEEITGRREWSNECLASSPPNL